MMIRILLAFSCLLLLSCFSNNKKEGDRVPASDPYAAEEMQKFLAQDPFAKDGYDHNKEGGYTNRKFQEGVETPQDQNVREVKELAGREIWFKSAPNERFHTYYFPQKINSSIAWYKILQAKRHDKRFQSYGLINDPDCCIPGRNCKQKGLLYHNVAPSMEDTFGWEYCAGDENLLDALKGKATWRDPACDHPILKAADSLDPQPRENRCEMAFGNPTGAVGYRKYPNPRFNLARWKKVGGWEGFEKRMLESEIDASIEPPFRIGKACASCHAAFDPLNPPQNITEPTWKNIKGETGNQYLNISAILGSGVKENALEYQMFVHARAGAVDTSAVPNDWVNNPGTINAIINFPRRPIFEDKVTRWENVDSCSAGADCQIINYPGGGRKYWKLMRSQNKQVMHILKGGEDSVGADLAVQRVYGNIGLCAEQCWVNHLTNLRELDSTQRGFGQTPFNIQQCRQDCPSWRANEDRVGDILSYLLSRRPTDLKDALYSKKPESLRSSELENFLNERYKAPLGTNLVSQGKEIFGAKCAQCHSSQNTDKNDLTPSEVPTGTDFLAKDYLEKSGEQLRIDWLGNDKSTSVAQVGTYQCRSLHSNHLSGHVWAQFSSDTYKARNPAVTNLRSQAQAGGRGYYRNISLLNAWAHAPFMHNNAVGPEICGRVSNLEKEYNPWRNSVEGTQLDATKKYLCEAYFDPSIAGRLALFEKSVDELLTPSSARRRKVALTDVPIKMPLAVKLGLFEYTQPLFIEFPAGIPLTTMGSFDLKTFSTEIAGAIPLYQAWLQSSNKAQALGAYEQYWITLTNGDPVAGKELAKASMETFEAFKNKDFETPKKNLKTFVRYYATCDAYGADGRPIAENMGHDFGTDLSNDEKKALKAFLATL